MTIVLTGLAKKHNTDCMFEGIYTVRNAKCVAVLPLALQKFV